MRQAYRAYGKVAVAMKRGGIGAPLHMLMLTNTAGINLSVKKKRPCTVASTRPFFLHRQNNPRRVSYRQWNQFGFNEQKLPSKISDKLAAFTCGILPIPSNDTSRRNHAWSPAGHSCACTCMCIQCNESSEALRLHHG
jgi:hypothetical protein